MGGTTFENQGIGKDAKTVFRALVDEAQYEHGHGGYTGTIAEKHDFKMIRPNEGEDPHACARRLIEEDDRRISDKWGPAGCIDCGSVAEHNVCVEAHNLTEVRRKRTRAEAPDDHRVFLFFGWASE